MAEFDITRKRDRDVRHCRTRAFGARLFAEHPRHPSNSEVWAYVARAWDELAALKQDIAKTDFRPDRSAAPGLCNCD